MDSGTKTAGSSLFSHGLKIAVVFCRFSQMSFRHGNLTPAFRPRWCAGCVTSPEDINKALGAAVSEAQRKLGLTQVSLAEDLGTTDRFISDMENRKTTPKLDTVALFAHRSGISEDAVIHDTPQGDVPFCVKQFLPG